MGLSHEIVLVKQVVKAVPTERRVVPVWDGETGKVSALVVQSSANTDDVIEALVAAGVENVQGIMGMEFEAGKKEQRFLILPGDVPGLVELAPFNELLARSIKPLAVGEREAILRVQVGTSDQVLTEALSGLFGRRIVGVSQVGAYRQVGPTTIFVNEGEIGRGIVTLRSVR